MRKAGILAILIIISLIGFGQEVSISAKHQKKLDKIKNPHKRALKYRKYYHKDSLRQAKDKAKGKVIQAIKDSLNSSRTNEFPKKVQHASTADSTYIATKAKNIGKVKINKATGVEIPEVTLDSTFSDQVKEKGKKLVLENAKDNSKEKLNNASGVQIPEVTLDSTFDDQVKEKGKKLVLEKAKDNSKEKLNNATGVEIPEVTLDSTFDDQVKEKGKKLVLEKAKDNSKEKLNKATGVQIPEVTLDSTFSDQVKEKGKKIAIEKAKEQPIVGEHLHGLKKENIDSLKALPADSLASRAKKVAIERGKNALKNTKEGKALSGLDKNESLGQLATQKASLEKTQADLRKIAQQDALKKQMTEKAKDFIVNNVEKIQQVQTKMTDLKKKYSAVPNSNDLSTATKRKSLKGESLMKRVVIGGNFNITSTDPFRIDLSPTLGYRINQLFEAGISLTYRTQATASSGIARDKAVYGQGLWANHLFYKNFFGYVEGERMSTLSVTDKRRTWKASVLIGVGRKFGIARWLEMQAMILFNPLHSHTDQLYASPVVFKTGVRVRL